ncbi:MAG: endonuclease/exonuclease/phosphatase family protein [Myxococcaceae bacterium]
MCDPAAVAPARLRVASYNLKSGMHTSLDEVAQVIAELSPDVIALQEVDRFVQRSGGVDQAQVIAEKLGYQEIYAAAMDRGTGSYGIALLTKLPVESVARVDLQATGTYEPRVAIDARMCVGPQTLRVVTTHADVLAAAANVLTVAARIAPAVGRGMIFMGDFNEGPGGVGPRKLRGQGMLDLIGQRAEGITFWPNKSRLDYLFVDSPLSERVLDVAITQNKASDHYPVYVDLDTSVGWRPVAL